MTTDRYTKAVLTVIAGALVGLFAQQSVHYANAQNEYQKVILCDGANCLKLYNAGLVPTISSMHQVP
jgi:hypothetical protein